MVTDSSDPERTEQWQLLTALGIGAILTLVGILGFILVPIQGQLFGIFGVNTLHNAVHLLTGIAGLAAGYFAAGAFSDGYNRYGGLTYLLIAALWLVVPAFLNQLLNIGLADTLLHLGLGLVLAVVGFRMVGRAS